MYKSIGGVRYVLNNYDLVWGSSEFFQQNFWISMILLLVLVIFVPVYGYFVAKKIYKYKILYFINYSNEKEDL